MKTKSNLKLRTLFSFVVLMLTHQLYSQTTDGLTLQQCIEYGTAHNTAVKKAELSIESADYGKMEARAAYLPQVSGNVNLLDNLKLQTMLLPGEFVGQPGTKVPVQFGTKYNLTAALEANQKLFDPNAYQTMKIAKQNTVVSQLNAQKTKEQLSYDIASAYYSAQITLTQRNLVVANLEKVDTLLQLMQIQLDNGFAKKVDVDRLQVNRTNLQTELDNSISNYEQQLLLLKYYMGMNLDEPLAIQVIDEKDNALTGLVGSESISTIDMQLLESQKQMYALNLQQVRYGYLPSLSMTFHSAAQFQQNDLRLFAPDASWFPNVYLGFNLNIPIFDGMSKYARASQIRIQMKQNELDLENLNASIKMQLASAQNKLTVNLKSLDVQQRNINLANEVYATTRSQYTNGMISLSEMVTAENDMRLAQSNYLTSLVQARIAALEIIKITGNYNTLK